MSTAPSRKGRSERLDEAEVRGVGRLRDAGWVSAAGARLRENRWPLAAAGAVLVGVNALAGGSIPVALAAFAAVAAVVAFTPPARMEAHPEAASHASAEGLSASDLAAALSDPLIILDSGGLIRQANAAAHEAFGPLAAGSDPSLRFRSPEIRDFLRRAADSPAGGGQIDYLERAPFERFYRVFAKPIGETGLTALVFRDQSEARRIDRMRADFVANASHELRTPLASIAGFIETMRGPARDDAAARDSFLQIMQGQTDRMSRLIDDLLSLSRLEMKALIDPAVKVDLAELVAAVIDSLGALAAEHGVSITHSLPDGPVRVAGSRDELTQVFENLLQNACKYGGSGGTVSVTMEEELAGKDREVRVTVRDWGPGIAEEHIPRLTERFYRVEDENGPRRKGTGLGLAIVKHILTRHGGYLSISSRPGEGAAFTVHLPGGRAA